jgi:N-ethylmaleimide reductase
MPPTSRAQPGTGIPSDLQLEYYTQRASDGGLIITEATAIAASARAYYHAPGLYADEHVTGWKRITDAVYAKGAYCRSIRTIAAPSMATTDAATPTTPPMR